MGSGVERRVQRLRQAVPPPGEARPDWWIICQLAQRLGFEGFDYQSAEEIFNELCDLSPIYAGLDWDRIDQSQYQWPVPDKDHPGTPILHEEEFKNGRGLFKIIRYRDPAETISDDFPVWLTTGRRLQSYHTRTQTGRAQGIDFKIDQRRSIKVDEREIGICPLLDSPCINSKRPGSIDGRHVQK